MKDLAIRHVGPTELTILGGTIAEVELSALLTQAPSGLNWAIAEYTDRYQLLQAPVTELRYLERARLFGPGGDLELRLDSGLYHWRFIGPAKVNWPSRYPGVDFWVKNGAISRLAVQPEKLLLWGTRGKDGRYHEGRMAAAKLDYPLTDQGDRAVILARVYSHLGRPQFVWYYGLEGWR